MCGIDTFCNRLLKTIELSPERQKAPITITAEELALISFLNLQECCFPIFDQQTLSWVGRRLISKLQHCNSSPTCTLYLFIVVDWSKVDNDILLEVQMLFTWTGSKRLNTNTNPTQIGSGRPTHPLHSATKDSVGLTVVACAALLGEESMIASCEHEQWLPCSLWVATG